jgi:hypothetical protein
MPRVPWSRDELIRVLALYCQVPFGAMHRRNPAVIALARSLGRSPSAVALKLVNFASLDPELRRRGVGGMRNSSALDRAVWSEFYGKWDILATHPILTDDSPAPDRSAASSHPTGVPPTGPTEAVRPSRQRRGQSFFRAAVFAAYNARCCITGITCQDLLRASHIVPWSCAPSLRLDPRNGLCLNALHDAAFDRGLITLGERFELLVSRQLKREVPETVYRTMFEARQGSPITLPERFRPGSEFVDYHRTNVFVA